MLANPGSPARSPRARPSGAARPAPAPCPSAASTPLARNSGRPPRTHPVAAEAATPPSAETGVAHAGDAGRRTEFLPQVEHVQSYIAPSPASPRPAITPSSSGARAAGSGPRRRRARCGVAAAWRASRRAQSHASAAVAPSRCGRHAGWRQALHAAAHHAARLNMPWKPLMGCRPDKRSIAVASSVDRDVRQRGGHAVSQHQRQQHCSSAKAAAGCPPRPPQTSASGRGTTVRCVAASTRPWPAARPPRHPAWHGDRQRLLASA